VRSWQIAYLSKLASVAAAGAFVELLFKKPQAS